MSGEIYFDNAATTSMCDEALEVFIKYSKELYYNAAAAYTPAAKIEKKIFDAQKEMLSRLGTSKGKLYFTSGGTESDNIAILGAAKRSRKKHIITSSIEHPAVLNTCKELETLGYEVTYLPVDEKGFIDPDDLAQAIYAQTFLVTIMHVNNETGSVQDIKELVRTAKECDENIIFHSDGVQAYGHLPLDLSDLGVDMYSISSHKIHGPKGMGALYIRDDKKIAPILFGGGQQDGYRPGTIDSPGILSFAKAFELTCYTKEKDEKIYRIKKFIEDKIKTDISDVICISGYENYSNHVLNVAFKGGKTPKRFCIHASTKGSCFLRVLHVLPRKM